MKTCTWFVVVASLLWLAASATPHGQAWAAPGGGSGTSPPPLTLAPNVMTLPVSGTLTGQPDANVALRFGLFDGPIPCPICVVPWFEESQVVAVRGGRFTVALGKRTPGGLTPELVLEHKSILVRYALAAAPNTWVGSMAITAAPAALTLSPGALGMASTTTPTLRVNNTTGHALVATTTNGGSPAVRVTQQNPANSSVALRSSSTGANGYGVHGKNSSTTGTAPGLRVAAANGTGARFVNVGGGDLIIGKNKTTGATVFRVANDGRMYGNGTELGLVGFQGAPGDDGVDGANGSPGQSIVNANSTCHGTDEPSCECPSGKTLILQTDGICSGTQNVCATLYDLCCVCAD